MKANSGDVLLRECVSECLREVYPRWILTNDKSYNSFQYKIHGFVQFQSISERSFYGSLFIFSSSSSILSGTQESILWAYLKIQSESVTSDMRRKKKNTKHTLYNHFPVYIISKVVVLCACVCERESVSVIRMVTEKSVEMARSNDVNLLAMNGEPH